MIRVQVLRDDQYASRIPKNGLHEIPANTAWKGCARKRAQFWWICPKWVLLAVLASMAFPCPIQ